MIRLIRTSTLLLLAAVLTTAAGAAPKTEVVTVRKSHQVAAPIGLNIRSKPSSKGRWLGSLEEGKKLQLAGGAALRPGFATVHLTQDGEDPTAYWAPIQAPVAGYVLYRALNGDGSSYFYVTPSR